MYSHCSSAAALLTTARFAGDLAVWRIAAWIFTLANMPSEVSPWVGPKGARPSVWPKICLWMKYSEFSYNDDVYLLIPPAEGFLAPVVIQLEDLEQCYDSGHFLCLHLYFDSFPSTYVQVPDLPYTDYSYDSSLTDALFYGLLWRSFPIITCYCTMTHS